MSEVERLEKRIDNMTAELHQAWAWIRAKDGKIAELEQRLLDAQHELFLHQERVKELEEERRWVPVKETLPDEGIDMLAVDGLSDPFIAYLEEEQWWRVCEPLGNGEQAVHWAQVTMWMDLPAGFLEVEP